MFQFQCGAIGRGRPPRTVRIIRMFQFQCGAIGSFMAECLAGCIIRFNSSVVRLVATGSSFSCGAMRFQFQCGAIGRFYSRCFLAGCRRFNSSVVRLVVVTEVVKVLDMLVSIPVWCDW